ncbi:tight adherence pilus pseudopilin TadF [Yersinia ruckeri]|uniref:tight adherence pilus pseudopilin TadF n=1 Tax=Yersinia ruckeri TaxID=29486 RepID=UPI0005AD0CCA|nr:tight adherence pilus pseudopilin TadF [Yersinia ruckeri]MCW6567518.1 hypothetical protein [Yersinia ruckeri]
MNARYLKLDNKGSITIESIAISILFFFLIQLLFGWVQYQTIQGKLDRSVYSLTSLLRERTQFYNKEPFVNRDQVEQLRLLAVNILSKYGFNDKDIIISVREIHFEEDSSTMVAQKLQKENPAGTFIDPGCIPINDMSTAVALAPKSGSGHWLSLYQVILCVSTDDWTNNIAFYPPSFRKIQSSAIMVER